MTDLDAVIAAALEFRPAEMNAEKLEEMVNQHPRLTVHERVELKTRLHAVHVAARALHETLLKLRPHLELPKV